MAGGRLVCIPCYLAHGHMKACKRTECANDSVIGCIKAMLNRQHVGDRLRSMNAWVDSSNTNDTCVCGITILLREPLLCSPAAETAVHPLTWRYESSSSSLGVSLTRGVFL